jgi:hypothetical protein
MSSENMPHEASRWLAQADLERSANRIDVLWRWAAVIPAAGRGLEYSACCSGRVCDVQDRPAVELPHPCDCLQSFRLFHAYQGAWAWDHFFDDATDFEKMAIGLEVSTLRWPFRSKKETDLRVFRDPKTDEIMLRLVGPFSFPGGDDPMVSFTFTITMDTVLNEEAVERLHEQLSHYVESKEQGNGAG